MNGAPPSIPGLTFIQNLGAGGYADVYLYQEAQPSRRVAVKVLRDATRSSSVRQQFRAEADAMATLSHPSIVPVYSVGMTADGRPYIVMMYFPRDALGERVKRERIGVAETIQIGIKLASAIETAHRAGILHRDIKPANVLTDQYGNPALGDFGIAADIAAADDADLGVSVPWSPPELLYATGAPSVRSDVYSLAATLWHILVGRSPFEVPGSDNSQFALMKRIRDTPPPSTGRPDVPMSLDRLLRSSMAKDPVMRPASAAAFARSLQAIEQELRLPRTELVLAADETGHTVTRADLVQEATRMQAPVVDAQGRRTSATPQPLAAADDPGTQRRLPSLLRANESTIAHGGGRSDSPVDTDDADDRPHSRVGVWVGLAVAVLAIVAVVLVLVFRPQTGPPPTTPEPVASTTPPDIGGVMPPGKPVIEAMRSGNSVTFTWTYDNPLDDDTFLWKDSEAGKVEPIDEPKVTRPAKSAGQTCVWVRVVRFSGNDAQREFTKGCTP